MRKIEKTIYNFDELSEDIKNKLIEEKKQNEYDFYIEYCLEDDMKNKASELVEEYFGKDGKFDGTYYSLCNCQGDGAMIEFTTYIEDLNKKYNILDDEEVRFITDKGIISNIRINHNDNFYYHEYTFSVDYDYYNNYDFEDIEGEYNISEDRFCTIDTRINNLLEDYNKHSTKSDFIKDIISMNTTLTRDGYNLIDIDNYCYDIDYIIEMLNENEYYENGDVYYG